MAETEYKNIERRASMINLDTRMNLRMVIEIVAISIVATIGYTTLQHDLSDLKLKLIEANRALDDLKARQWRPINDYFFMDSFSRLNNLKMPPHPGVNEDAGPR